MVDYPPIGNMKSRELSKPTMLGISGSTVEYTKLS